MAKGRKRSLKESLLRGNVVGVKKIPVVAKTVTVSATGAAAGFGTVVLEGLPTGNVLFMGAVAYLSFETSDGDIIATYDGDFALGTAATADATLSGAEVDLIQSTAMAQAVAQQSLGNRGVTASDYTSAAPVLYDNTDGSLDVNLNVLIDADSITDNESADFTVNGVVYLTLAVLGDD